MDESVQQIPGQLVDTGPLPVDVLEARMTLTERDLRDRLAQLRTRLVEDTTNGAPVRRLSDLAQSLVIVESRLDMVRQLRGEWT